MSDSKASGPRKRRLHLNHSEQNHEEKNRKNFDNLARKFRHCFRTKDLLAIMILLLCGLRLLLFTFEFRRTAEFPSLRRLRIGIFMTTHQSIGHLEFLSKCWISDSHRLELLRASDLIFYSSAAEIPFDILNQTGFRSVIVHRYQEAINLDDDAIKQEGAKSAMLDPYFNHWFDGYDW
jgi:hypothetical protein